MKLLSIISVLLAVPLSCSMATAKPRQSQLNLSLLQSQEATDVEGVLYTLCSMPKKGLKADITYLHHIKTSDGKMLQVYFPKDAKIPESGSKVRIKRGFRLGAGNELYASGQVEMLTEPVTKFDGLGVKNVVVAIVNYADKPDGNKASEASYAGIYKQVKEGFYAQSFNNISIEAKILDKVNVTQKSTDTCDGTFLYNMQNEIKAQAVARGVDAASIQHWQIVLPPTNGCGWCGLGSVAGPYTWINACNSYSVVGHELGHNFGLLHSNRFDNCDAKNWKTGCSNVEYGDGASLMGTAEGEFTALHKLKLKWLDQASSDPQTLFVKQSGTYKIEPIETLTTGIKALRLERAPGEVYFVEFRQAINYDAKINNIYHKSLGIHLWMNNSTASWRLKTIGVGQSFVDPSFPGGGLTIALESFSASGAVVKINFASNPPTATPTVKPTINPTSTPTVTPTVNPPTGINFFIAPKQQEYQYDSKRVFWSSIDVVIKKNDKPLNKIKTDYEILNEQGKSMRKLQKSTNVDGYAKFGLPIDKYMLPGKYRIRIAATIDKKVVVAPLVEFRVLN